MSILYRKFFPLLTRRFTCFPPRLLQFAPFSSLSSFATTPSRNVISGFLTKECGFSSSQVTTVMRKRPELLRTRSDHIAREAIRILRKSEFNESQLKRTIIGCPAILSLKVDEQLKPKMEFLKSLGLASKDLPLIIPLQPRVLATSLENFLIPSVLHLRTLFGSHLLCKALRQRPHILLRDFKKEVAPKVEFVKNNLGILEGSVAYARALGVVLCLRFETLEKRINDFAGLGFAEEEIRLIYRSNPRILLSSAKKIKENMDFLTNIAGLMPEIVASHALILNFNLEKTLKPRYELFEYLRANPCCKCQLSLVNFLGLSNKKFLQNFGQYSTQIKPSDHTIS